MFKFVLFQLAVSALAAPPVDVVPLENQQPTVIPIVSQSDEVEPNGTYHFSYETGNGIKREEIAYEKVIPRTRSGESNEGGEDDSGSNEIHVQQGSYSYTGPDGKVYTVRYIADENGFQPIGDHIPRVADNIQISSSAEKSGRALKSRDSIEAASVPKQVEAVVPAPEKPVESNQDKSAAKSSNLESSSDDTPAQGLSESTPVNVESPVENVPENPEPSATESAASSERSSDSGSTEKLEPLSTTAPERTSAAPEEVSSTVAEPISTAAPVQVPSVAPEEISTTAPVEVTSIVSAEISSSAPEDISTVAPVDVPVASSGEVSTPVADVATEGSGDVSNAEQATLASEPASQDIASDAAKSTPEQSNSDELSSTTVFA